MRIHPPDFSDARIPGQTKSAEDAKADLKPGLPTQIRPSSQLFTSLLGKLGLPNDKLSASIVTFARYFSLPLDPTLLTKIRRQSLSAEARNAASARDAASTAETPTVKTRQALSPEGPLRTLLQAREALSLAATAAADKGVELNRYSLEDYAAAIDPDKRRSADDRGNSHGNRSGGDGGPGGNGNGNFEAGGGDGGVRDDGSPDEDRGKDSEDVESLRNKILQAERQNPLISLMNRLPGKKGQRWMVLPFSFEDQGRDFAITLRILLTPPSMSLTPTVSAASTNFQAERMTLEIAGEKRRWLFIADNPAGGKLHLTGSFWPGLSPAGAAQPAASAGGTASAERSGKTAAKVLRALEKELAGLLGIETKQVRLRDDEEFAPFAPDSRNEALLSVNEEV